MAVRSLDKNLKKSIYSIDSSKGSRPLLMRKGTACSVKTEGSSQVVLLTSRMVVEHGGTSSHGSLSSKRFSAKYPDHGGRHILTGFQPRNTEHFSIIPLQRAPKYCLKLVTKSKLRQQGERLVNSRCVSYTFFGNAFTTMTWEFDARENSHVLTEVEPKGELVESAYRGSPVVSTEDDTGSVIGVVDCNADGDLQLVFLNASALESINKAITELGAGHTDEDGRDVTDSPAPPPGPLNARPGSNFSQELGAGYRDDDARDVTDSPAPPSGPSNARPERNFSQANITDSSATPSSAPDLSGPLSHMAIQESNTHGEKKISLERSPTEQDKCIWDKAVPCLESFQHLLTTVLKINLDPKRELGGDYRSLAGAMNKDMKYIWYLATMPSPVEELLRDCNPTLCTLRKKLSSEEVGRTDVANEITAWVEKEGCGCSKCCTSLR